MTADRQNGAAEVEAAKRKRVRVAARRFLQCSALVLSGLILFLSGAPAFGAQPYRVLILDQGDLSASYQANHALAIRAELTKIFPAPVEFYSEGLDIERFPQPAHQAHLIHWLREKYRDRTFNAIITLGPESLDFAIRFRREFGTTAPIIFTAIENYYVGRMALPPGVTGVAGMFSTADTIKLARQLLPEVKKVIVLGDAENQAGHLMDISREFIEISMNQEINVMTGMPVAKIRKYISNLPKDSVILYFGITNDSTGQYFLPDQLLSDLVEEANRPIFVTHRAFIGSGAVGGLVSQPADGAYQVAQMIRRIIINGEDASAIPVLKVDLRTPVFDDRALAGWQIDRDRLPPNSELLFEERSLWDRYSYHIVVVAVVLITQTALIVGLISEHRRRRRIELRFRRSMSDLAHLNRTIALGELSASIAHELNQPLAAILSNAESVQLLLNVDPPAISEAQEALADVVRENQRASDIIRSMRVLFKKGEFAPVACKVHDVLDEVVRFLAWEARSKDVTIVSEVDETLAPVLADRIQLQQLVLNLLMNAIEAVQSFPSRGSGRVVVGAQRVDSAGIEIYVRDNGPGIGGELLERIFDSHYTTKSSGMGMGLSICRAIAEAHGSRLNLDSEPGRGSCFSVVLSVAEIKL